MSFLPCDLCGFMINTDDDPECFQEYTNGEECIVCPKCRGEEEWRPEWKTEPGTGPFRS